MKTTHRCNRLMVNAYEDDPEYLGAVHYQTRTGRRYLWFIPRDRGTQKALPPHPGP